MAPCSSSCSCSSSRRLVLLHQCRTTTRGSVTITTRRIGRRIISSEGFSSDSDKVVCLTSLLAGVSLRTMRTQSLCSGGAAGAAGALSRRRNRRKRRGGRGRGRGGGGGGAIWTRALSDSDEEAPQETQEETHEEEEEDVLPELWSQLEIQGCPL
eukprot:CAMPEP_0197475092 /NCGR_PEP_ID=MMETSP1309-20131121/6538_1 /TAXON_ID=464262 /ORGANISM="Genus nov. species nov., Strain RCC998" /LENGTH=154 /DNA_ID=CAMNT_0043014987 /DNA_START=56 /DNA_END=517 /DNA_ORIENTATION=+